MNQIKYTIKEDSQEYFQETCNSTMNVQQFLQMISQKHNKNFKSLFCDGRDMNLEDLLEDYISYSCNSFCAIESVQSQPNDIKIKEDLIVIPNNEQIHKNLLAGQIERIIENDNSSENIKTKIDHNTKLSKSERKFDIKDYKCHTTASLKFETIGKTLLARNIHDPNVTFYGEKFTVTKTKELQLFSEKVELLLTINHPCLSKYVGYSKTGFLKKPKKGKVMNNPVLFSTVHSKGNLSTKNALFDETKRLIIIYGIVAGMKYLHSNNLNNSFLTAVNIQLDEFLFPKISFYGSSILNLLKEEEANMSVMQTIVITSLSFDQYAMKYNPYEHDVFLFSLILYEILGKKSPIDNYCIRSINDWDENGYRPNISDNIPECYRNLISQCWHHNIDRRPSFQEIELQLRQNHDFILKGANEEYYFEYIKLVDEYQNLADQTISFEAFVKSTNSKFKEFVAMDKEKKAIKEKNVSGVSNIDLTNLSIHKKIGEGLFGKAYVVESKESGKFLTAKISKKEIFDIDKSHIYRESSIMSQLLHPCILKFIGYSSKNFKNKDKPIIFTEFTKNGSLQQLFEYLRRDETLEEWNKTQQ